MTLLKSSSRGAPILLRQITFRASNLPATVFLLLLDAIVLAGLNNYSLRWGVFPPTANTSQIQREQRAAKKSYLRRFIPLHEQWLLLQIIAQLTCGKLYFRET